jgi:hypothetical protein
VTRWCSEPRCDQPATRKIDCRPLGALGDVEVCDPHGDMLDADLARIHQAAAKRAQRAGAR